MITLSLGKKLALGFGLGVMALVVLAAFTNYEMRNLGEMQDDGASRARDAVLATNAAAIGERAYGIIADAVINRNLDETVRNWKEDELLAQSEITKLASIVDTDRERESLRVGAAAYAEMNRLFTSEILPLLKAGNPDPAKVSRLDDQVDKQKDLVRESFQSIAKSLQNESAEADEHFDGIRSRVIWISTILSIVGIIGGIVTGLFITRSVTGAIRRVANELEASSNDLSVAANQVAQVSVRLSSSANQQAVALQQTAASANEVNAMVDKNAANARQTQEAARSGSEAATRGRETMQNVIEAISQIKKSNREITEQVKASNEEIAEITKVISEIAEKTKVINDIVFQTKLLSFNASVEAARAGEHGKGFAVVAEEVGNLAQMSGNAAHEISAMLETSIAKVEHIVKTSTATVEKMVEAGQEKVEIGMEAASSCGTVLEEIVRHVSHATSQVEEITLASDEQARGVNEITKAVEQIDQATQANTATSQEAAVSAERMETQVEKLRDALGDLLRVVDGEAYRSSVNHFSQSESRQPSNHHRMAA